MRILRPVSLALGLLMVLMVSSVGAQANVQQQAGIYVDFGNGDQTMVIVPFDEDSISSIELLERAGIPLLTVGFGGLGDAVCMIETTGCDLSACRRTLCQEGEPDAPFWQFMEQGSDGIWTTSPLGASAATVEDGDIDGWVWTGSAPALPLMTMGDLVTRTGFDQDGVASFSTFSSHSDESGNSRDLIAAVSVLGAATVLGGFLVVLRQRRHAAG
ncbi:MAG: hypothetical protein WKF81_11600 [Thermomicrobiales bacterium]